MTEIFIVKIGLSPELKNDIFEFIEKSYSLQINSQFKSEDPNDNISHRNRKIQHRLFSQKMQSYYVAYEPYGKNKNLRPRKLSLRVTQNIY